MLKKETMTKPVVETKVQPKPQPKPEVKASNPSEVVVEGKLYRSVAYQEDGPHSATKFRLEEVK